MKGLSIPQELAQARDRLRQGQLLRLQLAGQVQAQLLAVEHLSAKEAGQPVDPRAIAKLAVAGADALLVELGFIKLAEAEASGTSNTKVML